MKRVIPFLLLMVALRAHTQNLIFYQNTQSQVFLFKHGGSGPAAPLVDYFVQRIAQGNNKPLARTEYMLVHEDNVRLTKVDATHFDVQASLSGMRLNGDIQYRGFGMEEILKPGAVRFKLERRDVDGNPLQAWDFAEVPLGEEQSIIAAFRVVDSSGQFTQHKVLVQDKQFLYTDANRLAFEGRADLIDQYYLATPGLEVLYQEFLKVNAQDIDHLDAQDTELRRLVGKLDAVRAKDYTGQLGLTAQKDPAGFLPRFTELNVLAQDLQAKIADTRRRLPQLYFERGLAHAKANRMGEARNDYNYAVQLNPGFAPAHVELARLSYQAGAIGEAVNKLQFIFRDLQLDEASREKGRQLSNTIYQNHLGNANYAVQQGDFEKGLGELDLARNICTTIPVTPCDPQLEGLYTRAHKGIYTRHVTNGVKAEEGGRLDLAERDGLSAQEYQKRFPQYVGEGREAAALLGRVRKARYANMIAEADAVAQAKRLADAEKLAREAIAYQASYPTDVPDPAPARAALHRIKGLQYNDLIASAAVKAKLGEHRPALDGFEGAMALEREYEFQRDTTLGTQLKHAAKQVMLADGKKGLEMARSNRLSEAREVAKFYNHWSDQYALRGDAEIEGLRKELQGAIFSQECTNAQAEYNELLSGARIQERERRYDTADEFYKKAIAHVQLNHACALDMQVAVTAKEAIAPAAKYMEKMLEVRKSIEYVNYTAAVEGYIAAGDQFFRDDIGTRFGLTHASLFDFIKTSGRREFMLHGASHFADRKEYESSLALVYDLATKGYPKGKLKAIQTRLGKELAIRDKQADGSGDPKVKAAGYTKGNSAMGTLGKAYVKQWKAM